MNRRGLSLTELLLVLGVIAVLAAVTIPNFMQAELRTRVAEEKGRLAVVHLAFEAYAADQGDFPLWTQTSPFTAGSLIIPSPVPYEENEIWKVYPGYPSVSGMPCGLTTPVAYLLNTRALEDVFRAKHDYGSNLPGQIMYLSTNYYLGSYGTYPSQSRRYGAWVITSAGPDTYFRNHLDLLGDYGAGGWNLASYDPTNGMYSAGDIYRSDKLGGREDHV